MKHDFRPIRNIIFDLGGVLLDIHYLRTIEAFSELGLSEAEQAFSKASQGEIFQLFECGKVDETEFLNHLQREMANANHEDLIAGWNCMLGSFPSERLDFIKSINEQYDCFVLSNTNIIHQRAFEKIVDLSVGWENFASAFKKIYYSHHLKLRKPDVAIFQKVLHEQGLRASETCFVDDSPQHIEAARKTGMMAIHLLDSQEIWDVIPKRLTSS